ncbi:OTU family cysteine protease [Besnoitia besnoiti]|uniref:OTU family cysteine protease n=1 Tax=Besnoitia besnoiti TaxID=94643 RepID=A0A2A9MJP2_BESBE|nr:OTU family cysteine protease [Besnoitia besnoiti]PFH36471.1 OTU family cysteine protease [Besnoitia besnoiti]
MADESPAEAWLTNAASAEACQLDVSLSLAPGEPGLLNRDDLPPAGSDGPIVSGPPLGASGAASENGSHLSDSLPGGGAADSLESPVEPARLVSEDVHRDEEAAGELQSPQTLQSDSAPTPLSAVSKACSNQQATPPSVLTPTRPAPSPPCSIAAPPSSGPGTPSTTAHSRPAAVGPLEDSGAEKAIAAEPAQAADIAHRNVKSSQKESTGRSARIGSRGSTSTGEVDRERRGQETPVIVASAPTADLTADDLVAADGGQEAADARSICPAEKESRAEPEVVCGTGKKQAQESSPMTNASTTPAHLAPTSIGTRPCGTVSPKGNPAATPRAPETRSRKHLCPAGPAYRAVKNADAIRRKGSDKSETADELDDDLLRSRSGSASSVSSSTSCASASTTCSVSKDFDLKGLKARPPWWQELTKRHVEGDGNCMFRAFSDQLYGTQDYHFYLRRMAVEVMRIRRREFEPFVDEADGPNFDAYLEKIATAGEWADDRELRALSMLYDFSIEIYDDNFHVRKTFYEEEREKDAGGQKRTVRLIWSATPGHYSSVHRRSAAFPLSGDNPIGTLECRGLCRLLQLEEQQLEQEDSVTQLDEAEQKRLAAEWGLDPKEFQQLAEQQRQLLAEATAAERQQNTPQKKAHEICKRIWDVFEAARVAATAVQRERAVQQAAAGQVGCRVRAGDPKASGAAPTRTAPLTVYALPTTRARLGLARHGAAQLPHKSAGSLKTEAGRGAGPPACVAGEAWRAAPAYYAGSSPRVARDVNGARVPASGLPSTMGLISNSRPPRLVMPTGECSQTRPGELPRQVNRMPSGETGGVSSSRAHHLGADGRTAAGAGSGVSASITASPFFAPQVGNLLPYVGAAGTVESPAAGAVNRGALPWTSAQQAYMQEQERLRRQYEAQQKLKQPVGDAKVAGQALGHPLDLASGSAVSGTASTRQVLSVGHAFAAATGFPGSPASRQVSATSTTASAAPGSPHCSQHGCKYNEDKVLGFFGPGPVASSGDPSGSPLGSSISDTSPGISPTVSALSSLTAANHASAGGANIEDIIGGSRPLPPGDGSEVSGGASRLGNAVGLTSATSQKAAAHGTASPSTVEGGKGVANALVAHGLTGAQRPPSTASTAATAAGKGSTARQQVFTRPPHAGNNASAPFAPWKLKANPEPNVKHYIRRANGSYVEVDPTKLLAAYPTVTSSGYTLAGGVASLGAQAAADGLYARFPHQGVGAPGAAGVLRKGSSPGSDNASERSTAMGSLVSSDATPRSVTSSGSWFGSWLRSSNAASSR